VIPLILDPLAPLVKALVAWLATRQRQVAPAVAIGTGEARLQQRKPLAFQRPALDLAGQCLQLRLHLSQVRGPVIRLPG